MFFLAGLLSSDRHRRNPKQCTRSEDESAGPGSSLRNCGTGHSRGGAGHLFPDGLLCHCFTFQERVPDGPVEADQSRPCFPDSDGRHGFNRNISGMEKQYFRLPGTRKSAHAGKPRRGNRLFGVSSASAAKRRIIERKISGRPD